MRTAFRLAPFLCVLLAGCASRPLPKYEKPIARAQIQSVRTTAYTHTEADHLDYGCASALGTQLQCGPVHSAAADWSRWPAGTRFRVVETGEIYQVDDYGWALAGTNTIDLYKPSRAAMNAWGVRRVTIENLAWGDPSRSVAVLRPRSKYRHIKRMLAEFESNGMSFAPSAPTPVAMPPAPIIVARALPVERTRPLVAEPTSAVSSSRGVTVMKPFFTRGGP